MSRRDFNFIAVGLSFPSGITHTKSKSKQFIPFNNNGYKTTPCPSHLPPLYTTASVPLPQHEMKLLVREAIALRNGLLCVCVSASVGGFDS